MELKEIGVRETRKEGVVDGLNIVVRRHAGWIGEVFERK